MQSQDRLPPGVDPSVAARDPRVRLRRGLLREAALLRRREELLLQPLVRAGPERARFGESKIACEEPF